MNKEEIRKFYEENMYGVWRDNETVSFKLLGEDPKGKNTDQGPRNPFEAVGGELVKIIVENNGKKADFIVHAYLPEKDDAKKYPKGSPFIVCMHPIMPIGLALSKGYAVIVMESYKIASDDIRHQGAFYELYPYGSNEKEQTGVLMAWAWGASKILDAVYGGLGKELNLDPDASMVTGVSRWGKATAVCGAFDERFRMPIPTCSGAGGLALYSFVSEGKTYDLRKIGGPAEYTYSKNEPLDCLQSDAERGWFNDRFLQYKKPSDIPIDQENLALLAMDKKRFYFLIASYTGEDWVNAPAMWEAYKKADIKYTEEGLSDHFAVHFHKVGHAVIEEDMELITEYFDRMYYRHENNIDISRLKTTAFAGQEAGNAPRLRVRPYKSEDAEIITSWLKDEDTFIKWGGERFPSFPLTADMLNEKYTKLNGDCEEADNFYPMVAFDDSGIVGSFIIRYTSNDHDRLRLGWVVVDNAKRGHGYGKRMLEIGLKYCFEILKAKIVTIGVYEDNMSAFKCYRSVGFKENPSEPVRSVEYKGKTYKVIELEKKNNE